MTITRDKITFFSRSRGDTAPDERIIVDESEVPVDISGFSFVLTINKNKRPADTQDQIVSVQGVIASPEQSGVVQFPFTKEQADQEPGRYFYDIQQTDRQGYILTIEKGEYRFHQDISK